MSINNREVTAFGIPKFPSSKESRFSFVTPSGRRCTFTRDDGEICTLRIEPNIVLVAVAEPQDLAEESWLFLFLTRNNEFDALPKASSSMQSGGDEEETEVNRKQTSWLDMKDYSTSFVPIDVWKCAQAYPNVEKVTMHDGPNPHLDFVWAGWSLVTHIPKWTHGAGGDATAAVMILQDWFRQEPGIIDVPDLVKALPYGFEMLNYLPATVQSDCK